MPGRIIVTGGAGFIGVNIALALNDRGHDDLLIVDSLDCPGKEKNLRELGFRDYLDKDDFRQLFRDDALDPVATVFHMGACSSTTVTDEEFVMDNNYLYTKELCEWCLRTGARLIYASSGATYGDGARGYSDADDITPTLQPLNLYGRSKQRFDLWALREGALGSIAGLKYFNVYGPREGHKGDMRSVVGKAYEQIRETGELHLFRSHNERYADGEQERDFLYVGDAVRVSLFFHDHRDVSGLFNCGTGVARTWLDLGRAVFAAMDRRPKIRMVEMPEELRARYQYHTRADLSKLRAAGYAAPFAGVEDGVRDYVRDYLAADKQ